MPDIKFLKSSSLTTSVKLIESGDFGEIKIPNSQDFIPLSDNGKNFLIFKKLDDLGKKIALVIKDYEIEELSLDLNFSDSDTTKILFSILEFSWSFNKYKTSKKPHLKKIEVVCKNPDQVSKLFEPFRAILDGLNLCKTLAIEPANYMTPETFSTQCLELGKYGVDVTVLSKPEMQKLGMNALLGVAQGSSAEPKVVVMQYNGDKKSKDSIAYVGKGVCFDAGGLFIKDQKSMPLMKYDKSGACAVVGALLAIAKNRLKKNVIGVIGLVENMPDGNAQRPSDVITSMSGKTIEVVDTDAEGRLVLADCLYYTFKEFKPNAIISLATLTFATVVCLADQYGGLFSKDEKLAKLLIDKGEASGDNLWRLPLNHTFKKLLESEIADIKNLGIDWFGENASAAEFLHEFVGNTIFAHLDIAGVAWHSEHSTDPKLKGPTGFGVKLLHEFALSR